MLLGATRSLRTLPLRLQGSRLCRKLAPVDAFACIEEPVRDHTCRDVLAAFLHERHLRQRQSLTGTATHHAYAVHLFSTRRIRVLVVPLEPVWKCTCITTRRRPAYVQPTYLEGCTLQTVLTMKEASAVRNGKRQWQARTRDRRLTCGLPSSLGRCRFAPLVAASRCVLLAWMSSSANLSACSISSLTTAWSSGNRYWQTVREPSQPLDAISLTPPGEPRRSL